MVGDVNIPLSIMDKSDKKIRQENRRLEHYKPTNAYRIIHPTTIKHTFFLSVHVPFSRINHVRL